jgi:hypothetical protein
VTGSVRIFYPVHWLCATSCLRGSAISFEENFSKVRTVSNWFALSCGNTFSHLPGVIQQHIKSPYIYIAASMSTQGHVFTLFTGFLYYFHYSTGYSYLLLSNRNPEKLKIYGETYFGWETYSLLIISLLIF